MPKSLSRVLLADRHHGFAEGVRDALMPAGAGAFVSKRAVATVLLDAIDAVCRLPSHGATSKPPLNPTGDYR